MSIPMKIEKQSSKFIKPFVPTPTTLRQYKLGFIDEFISPVNVSVVLFFSPNSNHNPKFVSRLEKSLEKTLTRFYPLAGRYVEEIQTIDCNDEGAEFVYGKVNIKFQDFLDSKENVNFIADFIPFPTGVVSNQPLLGTQVTTFECGGVALGVSGTHKIVDASTLCTFINEWADINREEIETKFIGPYFNSSSLFPSRGLSPYQLPLTSDDMLSNYIRKKLVFSESFITNMKANGKNTARQLSKVQLVSAIIWKAFIGVDRATHNYPRESILIQPVNLREKMASLVPEKSCGNIWGICATKSTSLESSEELAEILSNSVKETISNFSMADHNSEEGQTMVLNTLSKMTNFSESTNAIIFTSWCRFPFYQADFGFGKPAWAAPGTLPVKNSAYLMDDARGNGVEAYVFMEVNDVPLFEEGLDLNVFAA